MIVKIQQNITALVTRSDLNQNVYIVNPKSSTSSVLGGSNNPMASNNKDTGHFLVGLCLTGLEVIVLVVWMLVEPPNLVTLDNRCQICRSALNYRTFAAYSLTCPLLVGVLVCVYSGLSCIKWKIHRSGGTARYVRFALDWTFIKRGRTVLQ